MNGRGARGALASLSPATVNARRGDYEAAGGVDVGALPMSRQGAGKRMSGIGGSARRLTGGGGGGGGGATRDHDRDEPSSVNGLGATTTNVSGAAPGSASRRRSGGRRSGVFSRDPRPVGDKVFNRACIESLIAFLAARGYDHPVSPKLLAAPTGKEFAHIISFMFRQLDPNFKLVGKVEDEVPIVFKRLCYPTNISKTAIQAVGSPHSWPNLLAALLWLVELLNYQRCVEEARPADAFDDEAGTRAFFTHVTESYQHFLRGDDGACDTLDDALRTKTMQRDGVMNDTVEALERENAELEARLEAANAEPSKLEAATSKLETLKADAAKFEGFITDMRKHRALLEDKVHERRAEVENTEARIRGVEETNSELRDKISKQDVNLKDVEKMLVERKSKDEQMNAVSRAKAAAEREALETEVVVERKLEEVETIVRQYNALADRLQLVPASSKRAAGVYYELRFHQRATTTAEMVSVDLRNTIKPALVNLRETYQTRIRECGERLASAQEATDEAAARVAARREENQGLEEKIRELEAEYQRRTNDADAEVDRLSAETGAYKAVAEKLRSRVAAELVQVQDAVKDVEAERAAAAETHAKEQSALNEDLLAAADLLIAHKQALQDIISWLEQSVAKAEKQQEVLVMPVGDTMTVVS